MASLSKENKSVVEVGGIDTFLRLSSRLPEKFRYKYKNADEGNTNVQSIEQR